MTDNSKARNPKRVLHVLLTEAGEPLASALVEFWKGIATVWGTWETVAPYGIRPSAVGKWSEEPLRARVSLLV